MWPSVRSRLPACFTESFRTSLYLGDTERENKKRKKNNEKSLENLACIVQPEPSASFNFAAAAASLRDVPIRCVSSSYSDTTPLASAVAQGSGDDLYIETPLTTVTTPTKPLTKTHIIPTKTQTLSEPEKEVKYSESLEFLLKTNFQTKPTTSSSEIINRQASRSSSRVSSRVSSRASSPESFADEQPSLQQLLTSTTKQQKSRSGKIPKHKEIRKARRRELNKIHAKNYRVKIKAEKEEVVQVLQHLEDRNFDLKKQIREMEEKKEWLSSYINMAVKKKTEEMKAAEEQRKREEEKQREAKQLQDDDLGLSLNIDELFNSILCSQGSFMEVMEIE